MKLKLNEKKKMEQLHLQINFFFKEDLVTESLKQRLTLTDPLGIFNY